MTIDTKVFRRNWIGFLITASGCALEFNDWIRLHIWYVPLALVAYGYFSLLFIEAARNHESYKQRLQLIQEAIPTTDAT